MKIRKFFTNGKTKDIIVRVKDIYHISPWMNPLLRITVRKFFPISQVRRRS